MSVHREFFLRRVTTHRNSAAVHKVRGYSKIDCLLSRDTSTSERQVRTVTEQNGVCDQKNRKGSAWVAKIYTSARMP